MLRLIGSLINKPVMSLRTSAQVAVATEPIINPDNLKIEGFYCQDRFSKNRIVLLSQDIRDILPQCYAINDHEVLAEPIELIRLKKVLQINYKLLGKPVFTVSKKKLGKVNDFAVELESMYIQKLYIGQPFIKSITGGQLSVDRSQIVEITNRKIVVNDILEAVKLREAVASAPVTS